LISRVTRSLAKTKWLVALLGTFGWACAPTVSTQAGHVAWPEGYTSDYFRVAPDSAGGADRGGRFALSPGLPIDTSWSLAADEWGSSGRGGFPTPEGLTPDELRRIDQGWTVARPFEFHVDEHGYVGGVAFQIVEASSEEVLSALLDVDQIPSALPLTHRATLVSRTGTNDLLVEVVQGTSLAKARYAVRLTRVGEHAIRFSMDPNHPHDIRDARGYFTATPFSERHTLVTVAVGIDLGQGLARSMFKRQVQKAALSAPAHLRRYVEPRSTASSTAVALR
jgi:hypothetical protein